MTTQEATMTTQEVADRFYQLALENNWNSIQDQFFSQDALSIEPPGVPGMQNAEGLTAIKKKAEMFNEMVEEVHGGYCSKPVVGGRYFSVAMGLDATMKGMGRQKMDEIAVYEVKDGKILREIFYF
jgi:hypothetical protein